MGGRPPRMNVGTERVLRVPTRGPPTDERFGIDIAAAAELPHGSLHPILARLEGLRWVESWWEQADAQAAPRPPRRRYRLTAAGAGQARDALAAVYRPGNPGLVPPHLAGGQA